MTDKVNLAEKLDSFDETWVPKVIGQLNGQMVKVVKFLGEYVWHDHEDQDELFLVLKGRIQIHLPQRVVQLDAGEMLIVPRGVRHKPVADALAEVMLLEPAETRSTGTVDHDYTIEPGDLESL
jgi:mannose-6-phosphate isomerase-like protein (cupin superfamily)